MELRQLRYFAKVVETGSFTAAAEMLHVSQPALGMQIRKLEDELGTKLLHRHSRGIAPTEAGRLIAHHAEAMIAHAARARQEVRADERRRAAIARWLNRSPSGSCATECGCTGEVPVGLTSARGLLRFIVHEQRIVPELGLVGISDAMMGQPINGFRDCPPSATTQGQVRDVVIKWLTVHPELRHYAAATAPSSRPTPCTCWYQSIK